MIEKLNGNDPDELKENEELAEEDQGIFVSQWKRIFNKESPVHAVAYMTDPRFAGQTAEEVKYAWPWLESYVGLKLLPLFFHKLLPSEGISQHDCTLLLWIS